VKSARHDNDVPKYQVLYIDVTRLNILEQVALCGSEIGVDVGSVSSSKQAPKQDIENCYPARKNLDVL
jgi:hypothetical protein